LSKYATRWHVLWTASKKIMTARKPQERGWLISRIFDMRDHAGTRVYSPAFIPHRAQRREGDPAASADTRAKMNNETALKYHLHLTAWFPFPRREGAARRG
jgi:hypothetical protein